MSGSAMILRSLVILFATCWTLVPVMAQENYPSRPITMIVPFGAGTTSDIVARSLGDAMSKELGQPIVVENKPGAGGTIGAELAANAKPDGYTLVLGTIASHGISTIMMSNVNYDPVKSFSPIMLVANAQNLLVVNKTVPTSTPAEFIAFAKQKGQLDFTSAGVGTTSELAGELIRMQLGAPLVHVPYRSGAAALTDVVAGVVPAMIWQATPLQPQIQAGTVKPIAALSKTRIASVPNVPTLSETLLPGFDSNAWFGILAPANTPANIVTRLHTVLASAMNSDVIKQRFRNLDLDPVSVGPDDFRKLITADLEKWRKVLQAVQPRN